MTFWLPSYLSLPYQRSLWMSLEWNESLEAYVLTAGTVCFPMRWSLLEKWNQPMSGIKRF